MRLFQQCLPSAIEEVRVEHRISFFLCQEGKENRRRKKKREAYSSLTKYVRISKPAFYARYTKTSAHCTIMGAFHIHVDLAFRMWRLHCFPARKHVLPLVYLCRPFWLVFCDCSWTIKKAEY